MRTRIVRVGRRDGKGQPPLPLPEEKSAERGRSRGRIRGIMAFAMQPAPYKEGRIYPRSLPLGRDGCWPEEALYTYDSEGHTLLVYFPRVEVHERRDFCEGEAEFALLYDLPVIFLLFRFGGQFWAEAPFSVHFVAERKRSTTVIEPNGLVRSDIEVHLVDSTTQVLAVRRRLTLPDEFALKVEEMMWEQITTGWDGREHYVAALERITRLEETEDLLERSVCRTLIG